MNVHRKQALAETVVVSFPAPVVKLPDGHHLVTGGAQQVMPACGATVVGIHVVPITGLENVSPSRQRSSRRHADRTGTTGMGEARSAGCQRIQMRRLHFGMAGTAHHLRVVLIGDD